MASWNPTEDGWFSGFADGEGCFMVVGHGRDRVDLTPQFTIGLRVDDLAVLETLKSGFGGSISYGPARNGSAPVAYWHVRTKAGVAALVEYFDRYPLRAKKVNDYLLWRSAVKIYLNAGRHDPRLSVLRDAIRTGRAFSHSMDKPDPLAPFEIQLGLGIES